MFDYIKGILTWLSGNGIVIEQNGIGFKVVCANPFTWQTSLNHEIKVYIYQYVREDAMLLFGFKSRDERELFIRLLTVSGIGPKSALAVLASGSPESIIQAIEAKDDKYLTRFPGIGKKTAAQIILDLKGKIANSAALQRSESAGETQSSALNEAIDALKMLGYSEREINKVMPELKKKELSAENYVKEALRLMVRR
ncbi:Holliday junction branch migration protein RuvA [Sporolactobacillus sp. Y61]|uniref:Holliday junction branch migration complex subunit RuvA n=1 Tax=Sporolactobacillus sp. Y61 TaxID=3160863 RepID=A0AAU8IDR7_9BACL|nr:Holliday junction branch migration protein RuvA [Sporolactobacillus sp. THM19-2]RYL94699.1 Holliday junction branch migration protein RuvA [Sporolactobacillus sp. THM19-2]